jgi:hypothetical protein
MNTIIITQDKEKFNFHVTFKVGADVDFFDMLNDFKAKINNKTWKSVEKVWEVSGTESEELRYWCLKSGFWDNVKWCGKWIMYGKEIKDDNQSFFTSTVFTSGDYNYWQSIFKDTLNTLFDDIQADKADEASQASEQASDFEDFVDLEIKRFGRF